MKTVITRRQLLQTLAAAGFGAAYASRVVADEADAAPAAAKVPELKPVPVKPQTRYPARLVNGQIIQPERPLAMIHETDVLVVGGGAAGFTAAVAAARAGAKTALVERYGYFGGLWTGGLVLLVISSHCTENGQSVKVLRGIGDELLERHLKYAGGVINQAAGKINPTTDPEITKCLMDEMIVEAGVKVFFHSWAAEVVMEGNTVRGVVLESKAGRQAILARVVIDTTGDGDIFAAAGAEYEQRLHAIGLVHRLGNTDRAQMDKLKEAGFKNLGAATPLPSVTWINLRGPSTDGLDVAELSRLELEHRRSIWQRVQKLNRIPGGEKVYLLQAAPQIGVRTTRLLAGVKQLTYAEAMQGTKFPDTIAVGGAQNGQHCGWPIPYGALVPKKVDGLLTAGRSICTDGKLVEDMRLIASCLTTGHAAGAAAAVAAQDRVQPRAVDVGKVQKLLVKQGAYLG